MPSVIILLRAQERRLVVEEKTSVVPPRMCTRVVPERWDRAVPPTYRPRGANIPGHRDILSPNEIRPIVLNGSEARPSSLDSMQGCPLRGAPVLILSDLICDTLHIRH